MIHIVYDLEFTVASKQQYIAEIIEIGAVRIIEENGQLHVDDMFQTFVKPTKTVTLSAATTKFTGITQEDIQKAPTFYIAISSFREWIQSINVEDTYLWGWGMDDKYQLIRQCHDENIPYDWVRNYNDLQQQLSNKISDEAFRQVGLKKAMEILGLEFEGTHHRAIHDAYNTAKIFMHRFADLTFEKNIASKDDLFRSRIVYQTSEDTRHFPFTGLASLLENG